MSATASKPNGRAPRVPLTVPTTAPAPEPAREPEAVNLAAAVLEVQALAGKLMRNADGQIQSRTYKYVTLDAVVDEVLPLLVERELLWRTFPTTHEDGSPALRYRMTHIPSGEFEEDVMKLAVEHATPQGQGSGITYARRYALTAYLNLTVDPDDDGRAASAIAPVDRYADAAASQSGATVPAAVQPTAAPAKSSERRASAKQRTMLEAKARAAGLGAGAHANVVLAAAGEPAREWRSEEHAEQTLDRLLDQLPSRLVDAVIAGIEGPKS